MSKVVGREVSIGARDCIPIKKVSRAAAVASGIDARALFMLGFVDDRTPVLDVLAHSGLPLSEAADALAVLCEVGAVVLVEPRVA